MIRADKYARYWKVNPTRGRLFNLLALGALCSCLLIECGSRLTNANSDELSSIKIGNQVWSAANLDVVTFRNGDSIPEVRSNEEWEKAGKEGMPAWCYYENNTDQGKIYGRMYNWYAVNDPRGLSPDGWHIPTNEEWIILETYLGLSEAGTRLKCDKGWKDNGNGDNSSGFCLLPGGYRSRDGSFHGSGEFIYLSGSTEDRLEDSKENKLFIWGRGVQFENRDVMRCALDKEFGLYVRCIKDSV